MKEKEFKVVIILFTSVDYFILILCPFVFISIYFFMHVTINNPWIKLLIIVKQ